MELGKGRRLSTLLPFAYLSWIAFVFLSCTDAGLQPISDENIEYVDDKLAVGGEFCTGDPFPGAFPVKLLLVVDQSASLQCTDPSNNRITALNQAGAALNANPNVQFGVIGFASWSRITDFTSNWNEAAEVLAPENGQGGPATDYQGSLSTVLRVLEQDMVKAGQAVRSRTKYMVIFLSDGIPEPRCNAGCDDGDVIPDSLYGVCNTTEEIDDGYYVDMHTLCPDYNQDQQITQKVRDIMALGEFYGVGDISLNTIFLFAPEEEVQAMCGDVLNNFGYDHDAAAELLTEMAVAGNGTFRDVNISTQLDFLDFNYESLLAPYEITEFFAVNMNALPSETGVLIDSDKDGVADSVEFENNMNRLTRDSDGDRFSDLFEMMFATKGFDPIDGSVPAMGCAGGQDRDGDGLIECEELFLGTDPLLPDSDGDRLPDGLELRFGLNPMVPDARIDHDFDGVLSGEEVRSGTCPTSPDEEAIVLNSIRYSMKPGPVNEDDTRCYEFGAQGITLVPTLSDPDVPNSKGLNRILVFGQEEPVGMAGTMGRHYVACVEARYLGDTYKDPPSGQINDLSSLRFVELQVFDPELHCLALGDDPATPFDTEGEQ